LGKQHPAAVCARMPARDRTTGGKTKGHHRDNNVTSTDLQKNGVGQPKRRRPTGKSPDNSPKNCFARTKVSTGKKTKTVEYWKARGGGEKTSRGPQKKTRGKDRLLQNNGPCRKLRQAETGIVGARKENFVAVQGVEKKALAEKEGQAPQKKVCGRGKTPCGKTQDRKGKPGLLRVDRPIGN